jgi:glutathione S-transferase
MFKNTFRGTNSKSMGFNMSIPVLYCIGISPWSEKARWALDFHGVSYEKVEYQVLAMAPLLKFKARKKRKFTDKLTVPLMIDGDEIYTDSFDIARYAERQGGSEQLFPEQDIQRIQRLDSLSERLLNLLRAEVFDRTKGNHQAKVERLSFVSEKWRERAVPVLDYMVNFLEKKYPVPAEESASTLLQEIRAELNGRPYVLDDFSYADITLAQPLQFVSPLGGPYYRLGEAQIKTMEDVELAREFSDLIEWRDALYEKHRL